MKSLIDIESRVDELLTAFEENEARLAEATVEGAEYVERTRISEELGSVLAEALGAEESKVNNIGRLLLDLKRDAEDCEDEAHALKQRAARLEKRRERLSAYVIATMDTFGKSKLVGSRVTLTRVEGRAKVCDDIDRVALPGKFWRFYEPRPCEPNKSLILEALTRGEEVPGVKLETGAPHLRVYR